MNAGRELDALVAEKVMGYYKATPESIGRGVRCWNKEGDCATTEFSPSTDIAAAWEVVEKLTKNLHEVKDGEWVLDRLGYLDGQYRCWFAMNVSDDVRWDIFAEADTAPLAICLAALKAVGHDPA